MVQPLMLAPTEPSHSVILSTKKALMIGDASVDSKFRPSRSSKLSTLAKAALTSVAPGVSQTTLIGLLPKLVLP